MSIFKIYFSPLHISIAASIALAPSYVSADTQHIYHPNQLNIFSDKKRTNHIKPNVLYIKDKNKSGNVTKIKLKSTKKSKPSFARMILNLLDENSTSKNSANNAHIQSTNQNHINKNTLNKNTLHKKAISQKAISQKDIHQEVINQKGSGKKIIYLTFDDGPSRGTLNVIKIFKEENIPVTMFCIGKMVEHNRAIFNIEKSMPNLFIANHTYSHANGHYTKFYSNTQGVVNDVNRAQAIIGGKKYLRLAGRNVWRLEHIRHNDYALSAHRRKVEIPAYDALAKEGYRIFGWNIEWNFNKYSKPAYGPYKMISRVRSFWKEHMRGKSNKLILLAHDFMFRNKHDAQKLKLFIEMLKKDGWAFSTVNTYSPQDAVIIPQTPVKTEEGVGSESQPHKSPLDVFKLDGFNLKSDSVIYLKALQLAKANNTKIKPGIY